MLSVDPVLPAWFVLPLAIFAALVVGGHLMMLQDPSIPASRRRIRTANGIVTLLVIPATAYLFGVVSPAERREFVLAAGASIGLLFIVLALAGADVANSLRLSAAERRQRRAHLRGLRSELDRVTRRARTASNTGGDDLSFRPDEPGEHSN